MMGPIQSLNVSAAAAVVFFCIALAATNPSVDEHKKMVYRNLPNRAGAEGLMAEIAGQVLGNVDPLPLDYHNYLFFSTTTFGEETMSVGVLTRVWATEPDSATAPQ